jgi:Zn-dependent peptidase ImmA (M78 family)
MHSELASRAKNWVDFLRREVNLSEPPVDLYAIARLRQIILLGLRFMVPRGLLLPVENGYEVYIRDHHNKNIDISGREPEGQLTTRQRFTLAHEIVHTVFYKFLGSTPTPDPIASNEMVLEGICNRTAGQILLPTHLLKREIADRTKIDSALILSIANKFRTPLVVTMDRLNAVESASPSRRCVLLVRKLEGSAEICASYFGAGLLSVLPQPPKYAQVTDWLTDFPVDVLEGRENDEYQISRKGRPVKFSKTRFGSSSLFFLEVQT